MNLHRLHGADNIAEACRTTAFSTDRGLDLLTDHRNRQVTRVLINNAGALMHARSIALANANAAQAHPRVSAPLQI